MQLKPYGVNLSRQNASQRKLKIEQSSYIILARNTTSIAIAQSKWQMGHYVIIGGGGFLGAHIISTLQKNEFDRRIIVVDPTPRKFETVQVDEKLVTYWKESFLDSKILNQVLPGACAVFHLAAIGHTGACAGNKKLVHDFNVLGTEQLLEKCREHGVRRFIFASSVAVSFVGEPLYNVSEDEKLPDPRKYLNHYSASKAEAEQLVLSQSTEKFKTVCLRFRAIYGAEDPNVTEKVANLIRRGLFIGMMSVHGREPISAASSAVNCAQSFYLADQMLQQKGGLHGRVYYILDGQNLGQYEFWAPLVVALGRTPPTTFIPYHLLAALVPFYEFLCYRILGSDPVLSKFDLAILATDNTYSIERARRELEYSPAPCQMPEAAEYYKKLKDVRNTPFFSQTFLIFLVVITLSIFLAFIFPQYK